MTYCQGIVPCSRTHMWRLKGFWPGSLHSGPTKSYFSHAQHNGLQWVSVIIQATEVLVNGRGNPLSAVSLWKRLSTQFLWTRALACSCKRSTTSYSCSCSGSWGGNCSGEDGRHITSTSIGGHPYYHTSRTPFWWKASPHHLPVFSLSWKELQA
jgi:hypothetical protein